MALTEKDIEKLVDEILFGAQERYVAELTDALIDDLMAGVFSAKDEIALDMIARANREKLDTILLQHRSKIADEVMTGVESTLKKGDARDLADLAAYYGAGHIGKTALTLSTLKAQEIAHQTARGLAEIISRQNIALAEQAAKAWYEVAGEAITARNLGLKTNDKIIAEAVAKLSAAGITTVDYKSGVSNSVDVAVRRHIVSQTSQAGGEMTLARLEAYDHQLVITSAHYGARPSHAEWQGRPCCLSGAQIVDGVTYPDFYDFTGYGTVTGLKGVNCKHSFGPYYPGITELPDLDFPKESEHFGMTSGEYFDATQRQRELERRIRNTKREIAAMEKAGLGLESPSYVQKRLVLGNQQRMQAQHVAASGLVRQSRREKAYGIGAQPRALRVAPTTLHAKDQMAARGVTDKQVADAYAKPLHIGETRYNARGEPSRQYIGKDATIAVNPDTGKVVTVWPTSSKRAKKWKERGNYGTTKAE